MNNGLVVVEVEPTGMQNCCSCFVNFLKVFSLVLLTYGLMVTTFVIDFQIESNNNGIIPLGYVEGGAIIMSIFIANVIFWGSLWCWGARKRDQLRKDIVERQLDMIRREEQEQQQRDLEEERRNIEQIRKQQGR